MDQVDEDLVGDILYYTNLENGHTLRKKDKLETVLIVSPPGVNSLSDLHQHWERDQKKRTGKRYEPLVPLRPSHCPNLQTALKNLIRLSMVQWGGVEEYTNFLAENKSLIPMNFDLELLQRYVERHEIERILITLFDVEGFDTRILSELISTFHSWSDRIPMVVLIEISTTVELFESRLSRSIITLLNANTCKSCDTFRQDQPFYDCYHLIQRDEDNEVFLDASMVKILTELVHNQSGTVGSFTRAIKFAYMSHFFANPLSILCSEAEESAAWNPALCRAIRNTQGFRNICESLSKGDKNQKEKARLLLSSDETLKTEAVKAVRSGQELTRSCMVAVHTLQEIYHQILGLEGFTPLESEAQLLASLPDLTQTEVYNAIGPALDQNTSASLQELKTFINRCSKRLGDLKGFVPPLDWNPIYSNPDSLFAERTYPNFDPDRRTRLDDIAERCDAFEQSGDLVHDHVDSNDFMVLLEHYLRAKTTDPTTGRPSNPFQAFMAEAYTVTLKSPLSSILHPRSRSALERALTRPADYLGCACCATSPPSNSVSRTDPRPDTGVLDKSTLPPTSLLLSMLNEAGSIVNVRDLWDAFRDTLCKSGDPQPPSPGESDEEADHASLDAQERQVLALFYRALADLKYLGLVKQSKRKPGVECIAKTAWMGL